MIAAPATMAAALTELDQAVRRVDDYRAQLDNLMDMLRAAGNLTNRLTTELQHTVAELEQCRGLLYEQRTQINRLQGQVAQLGAERDDWRARSGQ